jgi:hypothetical protein
VRVPSSLNPDEALKDFARRLADTIRNTILVRCIGPFGRLEVLDPSQDLLAELCSILDAAEPYYRATECAKLIGVMELASALNQTGDTGHRSSLARIASADLVQTNGLGLALCSAR